MIEILLTLASIAAAVGLDKVIENIDIFQNKKKEITADDVMKAVTTLTNSARAKGTDILNKLNDKLASMNMPIGASAAVKDVVIKTRKDATRALSKTRTNLANVESKLNTLDTRASTLASLPESTRGYFKDVKDDIVKGAEEAASDISNIEKGVEKYV